MPVVPPPLNDGLKLEEKTAEELGSADKLNQFLSTRGVDTSVWGIGNLKSVNAFYDELDGKESGLELWQRKDGQQQVVRTTHVLRAKVCSPESYANDIFLFNTWQQFGDGRTRVRNGLLSEKLTMTELPLAEHLFDVCERAVTEEEMQRVVEAALEITDKSQAPEYDPNYKCPLTVCEAVLISHTIELEESKSYAGLLTMYHLYTVDIVCKGLPPVNFNTLEFGHEDKNGHRKLKYIHAWVWLEWSQIQRYLLEGSKLTERKKQGSFESCEDMERWLSQFGELHLHEWGKNGLGSVEDLFGEIEDSKTDLELWGREDGVPILMRVVHVLQLKVCSNDPRLAGKFLFHAWQKTCGGQTRGVNRLFARKMTTEKLPYTMKTFEEEAKKAISSLLTNLVDVHIRPREGETPPSKALDLNIEKTRFMDHRVDVEESPSFRNVFTAYHLYTVEVEVTGLPVADFAALQVLPPNRSSASSLSASTSSLSNGSSKYSQFKVNGWQWVTWQQIVDKLASQAARLQRNTDRCRAGLSSMEARLTSVRKITDEMKAQSLNSELANGLDDAMAELVVEISAAKGETSEAQEPLSRKLPPSMVSELTRRNTVNLQDVEAEEARDGLPSFMPNQATGWFSMFLCGTCPMKNSSSASQVIGPIEAIRDPPDLSKGDEKSPFLVGGDNRTRQ